VSGWRRPKATVSIATTSSSSHWSDWCRDVLCAMNLVAVDLVVVLPLEW
jgi:hypothetical protein